MEKKEKVQKIYDLTDAMFDFLNDRDEDYGTVIIATVYTLGEIIRHLPNPELRNENLERAIVSLKKLVNEYNYAKSDEIKNENML